jgi:hypothetical protein
MQLCSQAVPEINIDLDSIIPLAVHKNVNYIADIETQEVVC